MAAAFPAEAKADVLSGAGFQPGTEYGSSGLPMKALVTWPGPLPERDPVWKIAWMNARRPTGKVALNV